jgi:hypothetical protein
MGITLWVHLASTFLLLLRGSCLSSSGHTGDHSHQHLYLDLVQPKPIEIPTHLCCRKAQVG